VNWQSIAVLVVSIVACFIAVATYIDKRATSRQETIKNEIQSSVEHLSDVLSERLETKENVSQLKVQIAALQVQVESLRADVKESK
jgi:peptidoglycan hydrolase CwlO-like protein